MNEIILIVMTLISGLLVIYHHLVYPLILRWMHKQKIENNKNPSNRIYSTTNEDVILPSITIVIPAYNEHRWIADKIRNLAIVDYPANLLKIIIACDGCTDDTGAIAIQTSLEAECAHLSIKICEFNKNRGKVAVINEIMQDINSNLVALSDVSALISVDAFQIAAKHFTNPEIGVLTGHYQLLNPGSVGEAAYWNYQSNIKASESSLGSTMGAHGAFYIFRKKLFSPLKPDTINDDFVLPMKIVAAGYRAEYEASIMALELEQADNNMDHQRRRRIAAGNLQQLLRLKNLMLPRYGSIAFIFFSGKALRVLMPFLMIFSLIGSLFLARDYTPFANIAALQILAYLLATWQLVFRPEHSHKIIQTLSYIVSGHVAGLVGSLRYLFGLESGRWQRIKPPLI